MTVAILIVDDEAQIRKFLRISLEANGYAVREARTGGEALQSCNEDLPRLMVLDLGLPDTDGIDLIRRLREWTSIPILVLSVCSLEFRKVAALDAGANDYLTKPFGISELLARCRVLLRDQLSIAHEPLIECGNLCIDRRRRRVMLDGHPVHLTPKEYALLNLLAANRGRISTHQHLLRGIWGEGHVDDTHYLRVLIAQLRRKLEDRSEQPRFVLTEPGVGYRFADD